MIKLDNVTVNFNQKTVLKGLSCFFEQGKKYAIMGESGCGKTTILNVISGLLKPSSGSVCLENNKISYIFQEPRLFEWLSVLENITVVSNLEKSVAIPQATNILSALGLSDSLNLYPSELSGGMKHRVSIARALMYDSEIILLDEPFRALDDETRKKTVEYLNSFINGKTVIMVTHDVNDIELCDFVANIKDFPITTISWENLASKSS